MKKQYTTPTITTIIIDHEFSIASGSDCNGAHKGKGHGKGKGCKAPFEELSMEFSTGLDSTINW